MRGKEDPNSIIGIEQRAKRLNPMRSAPGAMQSVGDAMPHALSVMRDNPHFLALNDVSFEVKRGEVLGIIGRNGAGKSTLLKILSEVTTPTKGSIKIRGRVASLLEVGTGFHPELTGRENIFLNGAILGMSKAEIALKFDEIVDFAEVDKFIDTPVKRYSSGMYVRLAFAVAAHLEPEILIVDEVLAVGDAQFQKKCLGKMGEVAKGGRTVLFVSHNMSAILQLCSIAAWIESGRVADIGDTRKVVSNYLRESQISLGEAVFDPKEGKDGVGLTRACVMDDQHQIRPDISYTKPFHIVFEYQVDYPTENLRIGFRLHNERNMPVLHSATSDCHALEKIVGTHGKHKALVQLPGAWLAPGRYYVELGVWSPQTGHHQHINDALAFDIIDASVGSIGEEVLRPILPWEII
jgi:lipopolysaccharide transport system ATP-binding protein